MARMMALCSLPRSNPGNRKEYALFPEVRVARLQLVQRQMKLHDEFLRYADLLASAEPLPRQFDAAAEDLGNNISDQSALLGDLDSRAESGARPRKRSCNSGATTSR